MAVELRMMLEEVRVELKSEARARSKETRGPA